MNQLQEAQKFLKDTHGLDTIYVQKNGDVPSHLICNAVQLIWAMKYLNPEKKSKFTYFKNMIFKKGAVTYSNKNSVLEYYKSQDIYYK